MEDSILYGKTTINTLSSFIELELVGQNCERPLRDFIVPMAMLERV